MIPKIEKLHIDNDVATLEGVRRPLSEAAKLEVKLLKAKKDTIGGFKYWFRGDCCVAMGRDTKNDFDLWDAASQLQEYAREMGFPVPDKFRFAFI